MKTRMFITVLLLLALSRLETSAQTIDVTSTGVGIGTDVPDATLAVNGSNGVVLRITAPINPQLYIQGSSSTAIFTVHDTAGAFVGTASAHPLNFYVNGATRGVIDTSGNFGIGTTSPSYKLQVSGSVRATSFIGDVNTYSDFVFKPGYRLASLSEVDAAVKRDGHLPDIPSETEARQNGVDVVSLQTKLLQKVEELTLYAIEQNQRMEAMQLEINRLKAKRAKGDIP